MSEYTTQVRLANGRAQVRTGEREWVVSRRDDAGGLDSCPLELLVAALGS